MIPLKCITVLKYDSLEVSFAEFYYLFIVAIWLTFGEMLYVIDMNVLFIYLMFNMVSLFSLYETVMLLCGYCSMTFVFVLFFYIFEVGWFEHNLVWERRK